MNSLKNTKVAEALTIDAARLLNGLSDGAEGTGRGADETFFSLDTPPWHVAVGSRAHPE